MRASNDYDALDNGHVITDEDLDVALLIEQIDHILKRPTPEQVKRVARTPRDRVRAVVNQRDAASQVSGVFAASSSFQPQTEGQHVDATRINQKGAILLGLDRKRTHTLRAAKGLAVLALGGPRSGKTLNMIVPNVRAAANAVVAITSDSKVLTHTADTRANDGKILVFDPTQSLSRPLPPARSFSEVRWSPVNPARQWMGATKVARAMVENLDFGKDSDYWSALSIDALAALLHAAALMPNGTAINAYGWVSEHRLDAAISILEDNGAADAAGGLKRLGGQDGRSQAFIFSTILPVLMAYQSEDLVSDRTRFLNAEEFVRSRDTLYVIVPQPAQQALAPLVAGLLYELREAAQGLVIEDARNPSSRYSPVLLAVDDTAGLIDRSTLASLAAEQGSLGLLLLLCLQHPSQLRPSRRTSLGAFMSAFGAIVILAGHVLDGSALDLVSTLMEKQASDRTTVSASGERTRNRTSAPASIALREALSNLGSLDALVVQAGNLNKISLTSGLEIGSERSGPLPGLSF